MPGNVDLFVSIHANAFGTDWNSANGWEIYTYQTGGVAEQAAKAIEAATNASGAGLKDRGCKTANFEANQKYIYACRSHRARDFILNKEGCEKPKSSSFRDDSRPGRCHGNH